MPLRAHYLAQGLTCRPEWIKILKRWGGFLDSYCEATSPKKGLQEDLPYWYGEVGLTSLLSAAAWRCGYPSLTSVGVNRGTLSKYAAGNADAYFVIRKKWFQLETKVTKPRGGIQAALTGVRKKLAAARQQLDTVDNEFYGDVGLALCFVVPYILMRRQQQLPYGSDFLERLYGRLKSQRRPLLALYTPKRRTTCWFPDTKTKRNWLFPGVVLVGRN